MSPSAGDRPLPRVAHVITRFIRGGADENTLLTCNGQAEAGYEVHLIVGSETHPAMLDRLDRRVVLHEMPSLLRRISSVHDLKSLFCLYSIFRKIRPGIVHTHESKAGIAGRWAAWFARVPIIVHGVHILAFVGSTGLSKYLFLFLERLAASVTDAFIDVSEGMKNECLVAGIGNEKNHFVIPSGMDIEKYRSAAAPEHWSFIIDSALVSMSIRGGPVQFVLMASALEPRKRVPEFLDVFSEVLKKFPQVVLLVCGEGPLMPAIQQRIEALELEGRVLMLGHRDDLERLIALCDVGIHAAEKEGLPRVLVQYVAARKPVAAAWLPGIEQIIRDQVNGYVSSGDDLTELSDNVSRLLRDTDKRISMSREASLIDLRAWDANQMTTSISGVYRQLGST